MANDMDMLIDIENLHDLNRHEEAKALQDLFDYKYGLSESKYKNDSEFENAKKEYEKKYGFLDNYV